jgi:hypothetical protein
MMTSPLLAVGVSDECKGPAKKCGGEDLKAKTQELLDAQSDLVETVAVFKPEIINEKKKAAMDRRQERAQLRLDRSTADDFKQINKKRKQKENPDPTDVENPKIDDFDEEFGAEMVGAVDDVIVAINELEDEISKASSTVSNKSRSVVQRQNFDSRSTISSFPPVPTTPSTAGQVMAAAITVAHVSQLALDIYDRSCRQTVGGFNASVACIAPAIINGAVQLSNELIINGYNDDTAREVSTIYAGVKEVYKHQEKLYENQERLWGPIWGGNVYSPGAQIFCNVVSETSAKYDKCMGVLTPLDNISVASDDSVTTTTTLRNRIEAIKLSVVGPDPNPEDPAPEPPVSIADLLAENKEKIEKLEAQQDRMEANQALIIELLTTPAGKRDGFNN